MVLNRQEYLKRFAGNSDVGIAPKPYPVCGEILVRELVVAAPPASRTVTRKPSRATSNPSSYTATLPPNKKRRNTKNSNKTPIAESVLQEEELRVATYMQRMGEVPEGDDNVGTRPKEQGHIVCTPFMGNYRKSLLAGPISNDEPAWIKNMRKSPCVQTENIPLDIVFRPMCFYTHAEHVGFVNFCFDLPGYPEWLESCPRLPDGDVYRVEMRKIMRQKGHTDNLAIPCFTFTDPTGVEHTALVTSRAEYGRIKKKSTSILGLMGSLHDIEVGRVKFVKLLRFHDPSSTRASKQRRTSTGVSQTRKPPVMEYAVRGKAIYTCTCCPFIEKSKLPTQHMFYPKPASKAKTKSRSMKRGGGEKSGNIGNGTVCGDDMYAFEKTIISARLRQFNEKSSANDRTSGSGLDPDYPIEVLADLCCDVSDDEKEYLAKGLTGRTKLQSNSAYGLEQETYVISHAEPSESEADSSDDEQELLDKIGLNISDILEIANPDDDDIWDEEALPSITLSKSGPSSTTAPQKTRAASRPAVAARDSSELSSLTPLEELGVEDITSAGLPSDIHAHGANARALPTDNVDDVDLDEISDVDFDEMMDIVTLLDCDVDIHGFEEISREQLVHRQATAEAPGADLSQSFGDIDETSVEWKRMIIESSRNEEKEMEKKEREEREEMEREEKEDREREEREEREKKEKADEERRDQQRRDEQDKRDQQQNGPIMNAWSNIAIDYDRERRLQEKIRERQALEREKAERLLRAQLAQHGHGPRDQEEVIRNEQTSVDNRQMARQLLPVDQEQLSATRQPHHVELQRATTPQDSKLSSTSTPNEEMEANRAADGHEHGCTQTGSHMTPSITVLPASSLEASRNVTTTAVPVVISLLSSDDESEPFGNVETGHIKPASDISSIMASLHAERMRLLEKAREKFREETKAAEHARIHAPVRSVLTDHQRAGFLVLPLQAVSDDDRGVFDEDLAYEVLQGTIKRTWVIGEDE